MRAWIYVIALTVITATSFAAPAIAQEGHPLKGSWIGTWAGNHNQGNDLLLVLNWDGKNISGTINPGTDNIQIKNATLNLALAIDAGCATGVTQTFGIVGTTSSDSLCADTLWELTAAAADNITQARATVVQGVTLRVSKDTSCP